MMRSLQGSQGSLQTLLQDLHSQASEAHKSRSALACSPHSAWLQLQAGSPSLEQASALLSACTRQDKTRIAPVPASQADEVDCSSGVDAAGPCCGGWESGVRGALLC